jgi:hypothetical protein
MGLFSSLLLIPSSILFLAAFFLKKQRDVSEDSKQISKQFFITFANQNKKKMRVFYKPYKQNKIGFNKNNFV